MSETGYERYAGSDGKYVMSRVKRRKQSELEGILQAPQRLECLHCGVIGVDLTPAEREALSAKHFKSASHRRSALRGQAGGAEVDTRPATAPEAA